MVSSDFGRSRRVLSHILGEFHWYSFVDVLSMQGEYLTE